MLTIITDSHVQKIQTAANDLVQFLKANKIFEVLNLSTGEKKIV